MGGRPQKREKASGRKEWELGSTWNLKWIHVGMLSQLDAFRVLRCPRFTLSSLVRCPRFTLVRVLRWYVGTLVRWYGFTVEAGDGVTLRGC